MRGKTLRLRYGILLYLSFIILAGTSYQLSFANQPYKPHNQEDEQATLISFTPLTEALFDTITPTSATTPTPPVQPTQIINTNTPTIDMTTLIEEPTGTMTPSPTYTDTPITPTSTIPALESSIEVLPSEPITTTSGTIYLPVILHFTEPVASEKVLFCRTPNRSIPDNNPTGITDVMSIADGRWVIDLDVFLKINHPYPGDLQIALSSSNSQIVTTLIDRPGYPTDPEGCGVDNYQVILDDEITLLVEGRCAASPPGVGGVYRPMSALSAFDLSLPSGDWSLHVSDLGNLDIGTLVSWCMLASLSPAPIPPTPTPTPPLPPTQRIINGVTGAPQSLPLDCESRSAVDWANFFGASIGELAFYNQLPHTDNPDTGFVGNVYGSWGQIPPNPYGVHAEPIAALLRQYNLPAKAKKGMSWTELRNEIASNQPVIVWIIGASAGALRGGSPSYYSPPSDGLTTIVAPYEHTVVITGYDSSHIYYLNGANIYSINSDRFLESWSALGNMAVYYDD